MIPHTQRKNIVRGYEYQEAEIKGGGMSEWPSTSICKCNHLLKNPLLTITSRYID